MAEVATIRSDVRALVRAPPPPAAIAGYVAHDEDADRDRTVRGIRRRVPGPERHDEAEERLEATGLGRASLSALRNGDGLDVGVIETLLAAMRCNSARVKPEQLGIIGKDHLQHRFLTAGCEMESFQYKRVAGCTDNVPGHRNGLWLVSSGLPAAPGDRRQLEPGIVNPFRVLGRFGASLDTILSQQRVDLDEPVILVLHMACSRVEYLDRGKSAVVVS